jgi:hypothetical protein
MEKPPPPPDRRFELATRIYVDLCGRNVHVDDGTLKMPVNADNLAKLSFKLAESFFRVQDDVNAANLPKNPNFKLGADDIAGWTK